MKKGLFKIILFTLIALFIFTGCEKEEKNESLVGKWNYYSDNKVNELVSYEFNEDKTGFFLYKEDITNFTYEYDETTVKITYEDETVFNYTYKIEKDILTIKDSFNDDITYKKVKEK